MKIAESSVYLASSRTASEYSEHRQTLVAWRQGKDPQRLEHGQSGERKQAAAAHHFAAQAAATVSLSEAARGRVPESPPVETEDISEEDRLMADLNMRILKALFERLTGRRLRLPDPGEVVSPTPPEPQTPPPDGAANGQQAVGWGVHYEASTIHHEAESTGFSARGLVVTEDGREIEIAVELSMSRSFTSVQQETLRLGDALKDPLVINYGAAAASLTEATFSFDIDVDGEADRIAFVAPGSGFLAFDRNGDGRVNDGSELFGALSGDGFADLAIHDTDGNGWIDENDAVYARLLIWAKNGSGEDQLFTLEDKGVGALSLGRVATSFALKDSANVLRGQVQATGLFLREDGTAGSLQQLDLVA